MSKNAQRANDNEKKVEKWWLRPSMVHCLGLAHCLATKLNSIFKEILLIYLAAPGLSSDTQVL